MRRADAGRSAECENVFIHLVFWWKLFLESTGRPSSSLTELLEDRAWVSLTLEAEGKVCATGTGLFVAVKEGHPAYHRWS